LGRFASVWLAERSGWISFVDGEIVKEYMATAGISRSASAGPVEAGREVRAAMGSGKRYFNVIVSFQEVGRALSEHLTTITKQGISLVRRAAGRSRDSLRAATVVTVSFAEAFLGRLSRKGGLRRKQKRSKQKAKHF